MIIELIEGLVSSGHAEWHEKKESALIFWKKRNELADLIYAWVFVTHEYNEKGFGLWNGRLDLHSL